MLLGRTVASAPSGACGDSMHVVWLHECSAFTVVASLRVQVTRRPQSMLEARDLPHSNLSRHLQAHLDKVVEVRISTHMPWGQ